MKTLNKVLRTSTAQGNSWTDTVRHIQTFLRVYRATPHSSTNISPYQALFNRPMNIGLPTPQDIPQDSQSCPIPQTSHTPSQLHKTLLKNDEKSKLKMCRDTNKKRRTKESSMKEGDYVLVKQSKKNKLSTPFNPLPYIIHKKKGSMITAKRNDHEVTRNSSHFKILRGLNPSCLQTPPEEPDIPEESYDLPGQNVRSGNAPQTDKRSADIQIPDNQPDISISRHDERSRNPQSDLSRLNERSRIDPNEQSTQSGRPRRDVRPPKYLKDYVLK